MIFRSRRLVKTEDLNPRGTLFGGKCMQWIDEEAAIFAMCQLGTKNVVTKLISEINFLAPGRIGDVIEFGMEVTHIGKTSLTFRCEVRNKDTKSTIVNIDKMVFVNVDENGNAAPHGVTEVKE
jgi:acyl-CoA hydrolase